MKAIIYAGIGLFSVASVYGVVDYYQSQKKGTLNQLYKEDEVQEVPAISPAEEVAVPVKNTESVVAGKPEEKNTAKAIKKIRVPRRTIRMEDFSRGKIEAPVEISVPLLPEKEPVEKKEEIKPVELKIETPVVKKEPSRKLSLDLFSRAPLRPRIVKEKLEKKTEN